MANLLELFDNVVEFQNYNGVPLAAGRMYVYALGRTRLMDTWSDVDGESLNPNPIILDDLGQCHCYVSDSFDYTIVVCDQFDNEVFSVDKYLLSKGEHSHADVAVAPSEHIGVSSYHVGEVTVYVPYLTGEVGKTYEGIDPIVVNNTLNRISANHIPLGVQDPLYFVEDSETACIIGCSAQTEIPSSLSSKWDEASDAVIANSAQWAEGAGYEAGSYVSIDNNTINVTGLQPEGDYAYNSALSSKLDVTATGQFLTGLPEDLVYSADITGLATTAQLDEKLDKSDSGNFYPMDSNPSGYINELPFDLATTGWVDSQGYLTAVDIPESAVWNATTQTVSANSAQWAGGTANPQIPVTSTSGISIFESGDKVYFNISADYAEKDWVTAQGYLTAETDWTDTITAASANAYEQATAAIPPAFDPSYISAQVDTKLNSAIYAADSGTFLTALPQDLVYTADIADMATTGDLTGKQDITGMTAYATVESLTAKQDAGSYLSSTDSANFLLTSDSGNFYPSDNPSAFITGVDLTPYQLTADMTAYQPAGAYLTTGDSANFYTTANESGFISEVPVGTMNESAFEYDANDKISGYNGSAFAGGSDVPEGVMVESGLEYNAINQISGYNGSAIAQYGHEAQWLVHDDTLVHASNSAQYALGVNLSAVAQLLGVDETVLFETTSTSGSPMTDTFNLSGSMVDYEKIKILYRPWNDSIIPEWFEFDYNKRGNSNIMRRSTTFTINPLRFIVCEFNFSADNSFSVSDVRFADSSFTTTTLDKSRGTIYKVIGIGRKA